MTSYLKINANGSIPSEVVDLTGVPKDEVLDELKKNLGHCGMGGSNEIYLASSTYTLWCSDGKRYKVEVLYDDDGLHKGLIPNHRGNAMVDLGRFTTKKYDYIGKSPQQSIKDTWGSNYFVGDIFFKITAGRPIPDISIFGDNPIFSILRRTHTPSARMISTYSDFEAMLNPRYARADYGRPDASGSTTWEFKDYHIIQKDCRNAEYLTLLESWGIRVAQHNNEN